MQSKKQYSRREGLVTVIDARYYEMDGIRLEIIPAS